MPECPRCCLQGMDALVKRLSVETGINIRLVYETFSQFEMTCSTGKFDFVFLCSLCDTRRSAGYILC